MRKKQELRDRLQKRFSSLTEQIKRWGINQAKFEKTATYKKAIRIWQEEFMMRFDAATFENDLPYTKNLDNALIKALIAETESPLIDNSDAILGAAKKEDSDFFIALGKILEKRKLNKLLTRNMALGPKSFPELVRWIWLSGCLWLMTDNAALQFLNGVFEENYTLAAYRKARTRPTRLIRHPDLPIIGAEWSTASADHLIGALGSRNKKVCVPVYKRGWSVSMGRLTRRRR